MAAQRRDFAQRDADRDGQVTFAEYTAVPKRVK
jgi:hypothetical protein